MLFNPRGDSDIKVTGVIVVLVRGEKVLNSKMNIVRVLKLKKICQEQVLFWNLYLCLRCENEFEPHPQIEILITFRGFFFQNFRRSPLSLTPGNSR